MKKLTDIASPVTVMLINFSVFFCAGLVFKFTFQQFLVLYVFDILLIPVFVKLDSKLFSAIFTSYRGVFPVPNLDQISRSFIRDPKRFYQEFSAFPRRRSGYLFFIHMTKVSLTGLLVVYYLPHQCSNFEQFLKYIIFELMAMSYLTGLYYIECSDFISKEFDRLIVDYKLSQYLIHIPQIKPKSSLTYIVLSTVTSVLLWAAFLSGVVVFTAEKASFGVLLEIIGIHLISMAFILRVVALYTHFFSDTVDDFNRKLLTLGNNLDGKLGYPLQCIHSESLVASLDQIYNDLITRLKIREAHISTLRNQEIEQSRFRALGELSAMVAHDLAGPLHVILSCYEILNERYKAILPVRVMDELRLNVDRCADLVYKLRSFVKNPEDPGEIGTNFKEVHEYVILLLQTQYKPSTVFKSMRFHTDARLDKVNIQLPRVDLSHILYNLYKNSLDDFVRNENSQ